MIALNTATIHREDSNAHEFTTAYLSEDEDEIAFLDAHGVVVLTVRRRPCEDGKSSTLIAEATSGRFDCAGGFEVLL